MPLLSLTIALLALPLVQRQHALPVEREAYLMGTVLRVRVIASDRPEGIAAIEGAFASVRRVDAMLSTWRDDSEIARLNHAPPHVPVALSAELRGLLREAVAWSRATAGAFDPSVGPLVDAWDLRGEGRIPSPERLAAARAAVGLDRFRFGDSATPAVRRHADAWLDTGGFGKGVALREAAMALRAAGITSAILNFGGQVLVIGSHRDDGWVVPVAHPSRRTEAALRLSLRDVSASTSGQSERSLQLEGRRIGHIVDPRSGEPVAPWGSVTVVARDAAVADMLSTALLVLGPEAGQRWAKDRKDIGVLFLIEREGKLLRRWNPALEPFLLSQSTAFPEEMSVADHR